jgi:hypothetical protein
MINLLQGDCLEKLKELKDNSVDSIVTDPPYELGFMGKSWDNTGIANNKELWAECLRVLKHGGHLLAFGGTRTYHKMACAIEDAGFEVRDMIEWIYSTGFPKSLNIGKAVDKRGGTTSDQSREFAEYIKNRRTELNITLSKADEVICGGTTNYSWFEGRPSGQRLPRKADYLKMKELLQLDDRYGSFMEETEREVLGQSLNKSGIGNAAKGHYTVGGTKAEYTTVTKGTSEFEGWGSQLKPAHEPICMARKPLEKGLNIAGNCLKWGVGGINIDASRVGTGEKLGRQASSTTMFGNGKMTKEDIIDNSGGLGRFPANLIHDGSEEVKACFPETKSTQSKISDERQNEGNSIFMDGVRNPENSYGDSGNASRFFKSIIYQAKANKSDRNEGCENLYILKDETPKDIKKEIEALLDIN